MIPNTYHVSSLSCSGIVSCTVAIFSTFGLNLGLQKMFCGVRCVKDISAKSTDLYLAKIWKGRHSAILIIGCRIVLSNHAGCDWFLGTPVIVLGVCMLVLSIVGLVGYDCNLTWLLLLVLLVLFGLSLFAFIVTFVGAGKAVSGREYKEYRLGDYSEWLQDRVNSRWPQIRSCMVVNNIVQGV